jgi:hypothetical protein
MVAPYLDIPLRPSVPGLSDPRPIMVEARTCRYRLLFLVRNAAFYECTEDGCTGCGCPTFDPEAGAIPQDVIDRLFQHAEMRHGGRA